MIIEFFGMPGSGKTALYKYLLELKEDSVIFKDQKNNKFFSHQWLLFLYILNPISLINILQFIYIVIKINGFSDAPRKIIKNSLYRYFVTREFLYGKNDKDVFILFEQNIFQMILSVLHLKEGINEKYIKKILNIFLPYTKNYIVVFSELDIKTAAIRINERTTNTSRFDLYHDEDLIANLYKLNQNIKLIKKVINNNYFKIIKLDMNKSIEENAAAMCRYLRKINEE